MPIRQGESAAKKFDHLRAREALAKDDGALLIDAMRLKDVLGDIEPD
ncbi:MAG: hypothetical protein KF779_02110 [Hyphomonadaceae bacterium]|nr:hypothetical protein [Hyphomonadaceae bacterium]